MTSKDRSELLAEVATLPATALLRPAHAAAVIGTSENVLANWRCVLRGPKFIREGRVVRYRLADLLDWAAKRTECTAEIGAK